MTAGRTIVLAPRLDHARAWCLDHHVAPHGRNTRLRSTREAAHGLTFAESDWLVVLPGTPLAIFETLIPGLITAPGPSIVDDLRTWYDDAQPGVFQHVFGAAT